jgi:hypothetical protein
MRRGRRGEADYLKISVHCQSRSYMILRWSLNRLVTAYKLASRSLKPWTIVRGTAGCEGLRVMPVLVTSIFA